MTLEVGQTIGPYELLETLHVSGTGLSYKVRNQLADRLEFLRILPKEFRADSEGLGRFLRQMRVHARLSHPNIAAFYSALELDGELVMTSEWVEGMTLADRLAAGPLPIALGVKFALQILSALEYAHENGVIHRNLSAANVIITADGSVKLTGFELAKTMTDKQLTVQGAALGLMDYASPEKVKGDLTIDHRSDIYELGAVLYELVAGSKVFNLESKFEMMQAHVHKQPRPLRELRPETPANLDHVILKALAKDPGARFQTAKEFREALEAMATPGGVGVGEKHASVQEAPREARQPVPIGSPTRIASVGGSRPAAQRRVASPYAAAYSDYSLKELLKVGLITFVIAGAGFVTLILIFEP